MLENVDVDNGHFKVFDSHARDIYGISDQYELKGLQIIKYDLPNDLDTSSDQLRKCFQQTLFFYSSQFSIVSSCSYWNIFAEKYNKQQMLSLLSI